LRPASTIDKHHARFRTLILAGLVFTFLIALQSSSVSAKIRITLNKAEQVEASNVCMVTDIIMDHAQTPVDINGKTYYVCCKSCKVRLKKVASLRIAKDPISGHTVDKSEAYIIKDYSTNSGDGKALYFESENSAVRYVNR